MMNAKRSWFKQFITCRGSLLQKVFRMNPYSLSCACSKRTGGFSDADFTVVIRKSVNLNKFILFYKRFERCHWYSTSKELVHRKQDTCAILLHAIHLHILSL